MFSPEFVVDYMRMAVQYRYLGRAHAVSNAPRRLGTQRVAPHFYYLNLLLPNHLQQRERQNLSHPADTCEPSVKDDFFQIMVKATVSLFTLSKAENDFTSIVRMTLDHVTMSSYSLTLYNLINGHPLLSNKSQPLNAN